MKNGLTIFVILLLLISANNFYDISLFGEGMDSILKLFHYVIFILIVIWLYIETIVKRKNFPNFKNKEQIKIDRCVILLICGQFISLFNATVFKDQNIFVSFITSMPMLIAFSSYFIFKRFSLSEKSFKKIIVILGVLYCCVFILSAITLPNPLFGTFEFDEERGGFRLRLKGIFWAALLFFLLINHYKLLQKNIFLFLAFIIYLFIVASLSRQYILWSSLLGGFFFLKGIKFRKFLLLISTIVVLSVTVIPQIPLVENLIELSEAQKDRNDYEQDDVRVRDYRVFLFEYDRNFFQYLFGCGLGSQGNSKWGNELEMMNESLHLVIADASLAGTVLLYGYYSLFIWLFIFTYSILFIKGPLYIRFFLTYMFLCAILGGTLTYFYEVIIIMFVLSGISFSSSIKNFPKTTMVSRKNKY